jgi:opacity protein-like surface antigen
MKMKRFYTVIFMLMIGSYCAAQNNSIGNELARQFDKYFEMDSISATFISLKAKPAYVNTSVQIKSLIDNLLSIQNRKLAYVRYAHKRDIWGRNAANTLVLLDSIDLNNNNSSELRTAASESQKLVKHPWFIYFGGQGMFNSDYVNVAFNVRAGFFLLLNKWDLALSHGLNVSDTGEGGALTINVPIGLSSKYYFPTTIKSQRISPYLGAGIAYAYVRTDNYISEHYNTEEEWQPDYSALAGLSWALGPGSLDLGLQYGKLSKFGVSIGYTFFPWRK